MLRATSSQRPFNKLYKPPHQQIGIRCPKPLPLTAVQWWFEWPAWCGSPIHVRRLWYHPSSSGKPAELTSMPLLTCPSGPLWCRCLNTCPVLLLCCSVPPTTISFGRCSFRFPQMCIEHWTEARQQLWWRSFSKWETLVRKGMMTFEWWITFERAELFPELPTWPSSQPGQWDWLSQSTYH